MTIDAGGASDAVGPPPVGPGPAQALANISVAMSSANGTFSDLMCEPPPGFQRMRWDLRRIMAVRRNDFNVRLRISDVKLDFVCVSADSPYLPRCPAVHGAPGLSGSAGRRR